VAELRAPRSTQNLALLAPICLGTRHCLLSPRKEALGSPPRAADLLLRAPPSIRHRPNLAPGQPLDWVMAAASPLHPCCCGTGRALVRHPAQPFRLKPALARSRNGGASLGHRRIVFCPQPARSPNPVTTSGAAGGPARAGCATPRHQPPPTASSLRPLPHPDALCRCGRHGRSLKAAGHRPPPRFALARPQPATSNKPRV